MREVKPSRKKRCGVDAEVKELLKEETWIRRNITDNVVRGRSIAEIMKKISHKIAANLTVETEEKIQEIVQSSNPHSKVFGLRRRVKMNCNVDFPLRDSNKGKMY